MNVNASAIYLRGRVARLTTERDALRAALAEASTHVHDCEELLTPATRRAIYESLAAVTAAPAAAPEPPKEPK